MSHNLDNLVGSDADDSSMSSMLISIEDSDDDSQFDMDVQSISSSSSTDSADESADDEYEDDDEDEDEDKVENSGSGAATNNLEKLTRYWNRLPIGLNISFDSSELGDATYMQFREPPFVRVMAELVRPTRMIKPQSQPGMHHFTFMFELTHHQALELASEQGGVVFRFGELKRHQPQIDKLPEPMSISICVNDQSLPCGVIQGPINITAQVMLARNKVTSVVHMHWLPDFKVQSCFSVELIRRLSVPEMLKRIQMQVRPKQVTQSLVQTVLGMANNPMDNHSFRSINLMLLCPMSMQRMQYPCRASTCMHLDCFDALEYLNRVIHTNDWHCPVCHTAIIWENIEIDEYFVELINYSFLMDVVHLETPVPGIMTPKSATSSDDDDEGAVILPIPEDDLDEDTDEEPEPEVDLDEADYIESALP